MLGGLLRSRGIEVREQATYWGDWPGDRQPSWAGQDVTTLSALQLGAVYGSVRLISDSISTLPVDVFRKSGDDRIEVVAPGWLQEPTVDLGFPEWCSQVLTALLLWGNAYVVVTRSEGGQILELIPLDPDRVRVERVNGRKTYVINGQPFTGEVVHIKGLMLPGSDIGVSPIEAARQTMGLGLAALKYGGEFFDNEGQMPGVIEAPRPMQPELMRETAKAWRRSRQKGGRGLPGVLQDGATWKPTGITNEQAQFLSTRQFTAAEIAGQIFLVDPSDLGIPVQGTSLTYANLEQRNARRLQVTLLPWIVRIEAAVSELLFMPRYMKFNVNAFLRGDLQTRYSAYQVGIDAGFLFTDEVREFEDLPPRDEPSTEAPDDNLDA